MGSSTKPQGLMAASRPRAVKLSVEGFTQSLSMMSSSLRLVELAGLAHDRAVGGDEQGDGEGGDADGADEHAVAVVQQLVLHATVAGEGFLTRAGGQVVDADEAHLVAVGEVHGGEGGELLLARACTWSPRR